MNDEDFVPFGLLEQGALGMIYRYMKKLLLCWGLLLAGMLPSFAQEAFVKILRAEGATTFTALFRRADDGKKILVDWGDGKQQEIEGQPWSSNIVVSGNAKGKYIKIMAPLSYADLSGDKDKNNGIIAVEALGQSQLTQLEARYNQLTSIDLKQFPALQNLDLSNNTTLTQLEISGQKTLERVTATGCQLVTLSVGNCPKLVEITADKNELPKVALQDLPVLKKLSLMNNALLEIDLRSFPNLTSLALGYNGFQSIDVSPLVKLEKLILNNNYIKGINLQNNKELLELYLEHNQLSKISLSEQKGLLRLNLAANNLRNVDLSNQTKLSEVHVGENSEIFDLDVSHLASLRQLFIDKTSIAGIDLSQNNQLQKLDLRSTRLSACALNRIIEQLPGLYSASYSINLWLENTPWVYANAALITDKKWTTDVDLTKVQTQASCSDVAVTLIVGEHGEASATLEGKPFVSGSKVPTGAVLRLHVKPHEGYKIAGITYTDVDNNQSPITLPLQGLGFVAKEVPSTITVTFKPITSEVITLTTNLPLASNVDLPMRRSAEDSEGTIEVNWGNGEWQEYSVTTQEDLVSYVSGTTAGKQIQIRGSVEKLIASDLQLTQVDLESAQELKELDLYNNELVGINLSKNTQLEDLNLAMNQIETIDLSQNKALRKLLIYSNQLKALQLQGLDRLQHIDAKNMSLSGITLDNLSQLLVLDLQNNKISSLDLAGAKALRELRISGNMIKEIETKGLNALEVLTAENAQLEKVDLSKNLKLRRLYVGDNKLKELILSPQMEQLVYVDCGDNNLSACALNDLYRSLPQWNGTAADDAISTLFNKGVKADRKNQAETSDTSIATAKRWKPAAMGDGSGCANSVEEIEPGRGFNYYIQEGLLTLVLAPEYAQVGATLYTIDGKMVACSETDAAIRTFDVTRGAYLLQIGTKAIKVLIP